jgi:OmpA-OmpF porin, OOP family
MNKIKVFVSAAIATSAILLNQQTFASDDESFYIGGGIGQVEATSFCSDVTSPFTCEGTDTALMAIVGFQSSRFFAVELGYADFGKFEMSGNGTATGTVCNPVCSFTSGTYSYTDTLKSKGIKFAGIVSVPLGKRLSLLGKFGLLHWTANGNSTLTTAGFPPGAFNIYPATGSFGGHAFGNNIASESGDSPMYGFGLKYEINEQLAARGEFEIAHQIGTTVTGQYNYMVYSASLLYKF